MFTLLFSKWNNYEPSYILGYRTHLVALLARIRLGRNEHFLETIKISQYLGILQNRRKLGRGKICFSDFLQTNISSKYSDCDT